MIEANKIFQGNCLEVLKTFDDNSIDSCVTDPPYGINFMNKHWDYDVPKVEVWQEILRVLKPGGHLLCACGTRTQHRMAVNIEDAGFEIRDVITWHYGSGFPKSLDISKAIDKQAGVEREVIGEKIERGGKRNRNPIDDDRFGYQYRKLGDNTIDETAPATDAAKQWQGWGTALKPATEFWTLARKPLSEKTVAENVLKYGTGGINIDGSRIDFVNEADKGDPNRFKGQKFLSPEKGWNQNDLVCNSTVGLKGRFPANVIFDEFTGKILDEQTGVLTSGTLNAGAVKAKSNFNGNADNWESQEREASEGGASRFFYCPKSDNFERNKGLKDFEKKQSGFISNTSGQHLTRRDGGAPDPKANNHPTVKPIDLMRYLVKLITPKGGIVIDPYCGSGTTCIGAKLELINYIGIERELEYCKIAEARIAAWNPERYKAQTLF